MATQIASTPVIKGNSAKIIYREATKKPSEDVKKGAKKLADIFEKIGD